MRRIARRHTAVRLLDFAKYVRLDAAKRTRSIGCLCVSKEMSFQQIEGEAMKTRAIRRLLACLLSSNDKGRSSTGFVAIALCASLWGSGLNAQNLAWAPQQRIGGVGSSTGPSLAVFDYRLFAVWKGVPGDEGVYWSDLDVVGDRWAPQKRIDGVGTSNRLSLAVFQNKLFAAWKGVRDDDGVYWSSFDG
ncbi:MAG TPA: hypothetical protein VMJ31_05330, partial [Methylocystis sp.]|nr:hypothetical protein [Methylocystis sp.]